MPTTSIVLDQPIPHYLAHELEKRIFFISDQILDYRLIIEQAQIRGVELTTATPAQPDELSRKVNYIVANDVINQRDIASKIIWRSPHTRPSQATMFEQLVAHGVALEVGEGQICVGEPFIQLMHYFDQELRAIAVERLGGREYQYPTLIPTSVLEKCGYFTSFPHFLMFVTRLHSDVATYTGFLEDYAAGRDVRSFALEHCRDLTYCLPPTMCFHTYHQYRDRKLDGQQLVITARGKSFRFESRYARSLERLWDFTIREIVFMGSHEFVLGCREQFMQHVFALIDRLGLTGFCEVANDPFFCNADSASKIWSQKILELKYELRLNVAPDRTIAVGSFNFHENFFGKGFNITSETDEWVKTACVGFGLERLTYAFLCQYGLDASAWPLAVRRGIERVAHPSLAHT